jgi:hypothetical protein
MVASLSLVGCAVNEDVAAVSAAIVTAPGGWSLNGPDLTGINDAVTGDPNVTFTGVRPVGSAADGTQISIADSGPALSGAGFVGSHWTGMLSSGATVPLTITAASQAGGSNTDVWWYTFYATVGHQQVALCTDPNGNAIAADTVRGTWNTQQGVAGGGGYLPNDSHFTVACVDSSIAKCLELGYKPWTGHSREAAACVRAMRGDYCGDGTPYTVPMTQIGIFDDAGIQADDNWPVEAAWTPDGAVCIVDEYATRFARYLGQDPTCFPDRLPSSPACGMSYSWKVAIVTELPPPQ